MLGQMGYFDACITILGHLAGYVGNMLATCQQHVKMLPIFDQNVCRGQHILALTQDFCVGDLQQ